MIYTNTCTLSLQLSFFLSLFLHVLFSQISLICSRIFDDAYEYMFVSLRGSIVFCRFSLWNLVMFSLYVRFLHFSGYPLWFSLWILVVFLFSTITDAFLFSFLITYTHVLDVSRCCVMTHGYTFSVHLWLCWPYTWLKKGTSALLCRDQVYVFW